MVRTAALAAAGIALASTFMVHVPVVSAADTVVGSPSPSPPKADISGKLVGYVPYLQGVASNVCPSAYPAKPSSPCKLESFQSYDEPVAPPVAYGERLLYQTSPAYSSDSMLKIVSLSSRSLQNVSTRSVDFLKDCSINTTFPSQYYMYGPTVLGTPVPHVGSNGKLEPPSKDQQTRAVGFDRTGDNTSALHVWDIDLSVENACRADHVADTNLSVGSASYANLVCTARSDVIEDNSTGVVRSTHYSLVLHDWNMGTCLGRDSHGASTCLKLATITTFSNGSKLESSVVDVYGWPDSLEFSPMAPYSAGSIGCYYDSATDSLIAMPVFRSNDPALVRVGPLASAQYSAHVVIVRTLEYPKVFPKPGTLVNVNGNVGFISNNNFVVFSTEGDLLVNKSMTVLFGAAPPTRFGGPGFVQAAYIPHA